MRKLFKALRREFLDLTFATGGYRVEIVERPGKWISSLRLEKLQRDLETVAAATVDAGSLDYGVLSGDRERLENSIITLVRRQSDGRPIAFNALALMNLQLAPADTRVVHLGLVMVDPAEQSRGLSWILYGLTCLLLFVRRGLKPLYISNVTQVPAVVGMVSETFSEVVPKPDAPEPKDFRKVLIAREIMRCHRHVFGVGVEADFDEKHFIIKNAYTGGSDNLKKTFDEAPAHRDPSYNEWCRKVLDYQRGDDILQIGLLDLTAAQKYVARSIPRRSLLQIAALAMLVFARRAVLPAIHWFDTGSSYGLLRAR